MASVNAAYQTFTTWNSGALATNDARALWDSYASRMFRYIDSGHYADNTVYTAAQAYATQKINDQKLYSTTKPIKNPVNRLQNAYTSAMYGGTLDFENLKTGAMPIITEDDALRDAIRQLWLWSNMSTRKSLYVRHGCTLGDVGIKVIDDRRRGKVSLDFMHPGLFEEVDFDDMGNVKRCVIAYTYIDQELSNKTRTKTFKYREEITKESFRTYRDGELYAYPYNLNANGEAMAEWDNEYGFVPVVMAKHHDIGKAFGANAFYAVWNKIDYLNDLMTLINKNVRKTVVNAHVADFKKGDNITATQDDDSITIIHIPEEKTLTPLVFPLDIAGALQLAKEMEEDIERDLPELVLHRIRESGNLTAPGVRAAYADAIGKFEEAQGNYDSKLTEAMKMSISIGGLGNYRNFERFDLTSFDKGDLEFHIGSRPIIDDKLSKSEKVTFMIQVLDKTPRLRRLVLEQLDISTDTLDDLEKEEQAESNQGLATIADAIRSLGTNGATDEQETETTIDEPTQQSAVPVAAG